MMMRRMATMTTTTIYTALQAVINYFVLFCLFSGELCESLDFS